MTCLVNSGYLPNMLDNVGGEREGGGVKSGSTRLLGSNSNLVL